MSHELETMFYADAETGKAVVPWHGLGIGVSEAKTSAEALKLAGLDWQVEPEPVFVRGKAVKGLQATVRNTDDKVFGVMSERYKIVQNSEAFSFTDYLLKNDKGIEVTYETAGSLEGGRRVWVLAKLPEKIVLGDSIIPYLAFVNSHDGKGSIKAVTTPTRVVCANTLSLAMDGAARTWSSRHTGDVESKIYEAHRALELAETYMTEFEKQAEELQQIKLHNDIVVEFLNRIFPWPKVVAPTERAMAAVKRDRAGFMELYNNKPDILKFKGTAWGLYNALSDYETHVMPKRTSMTFRARKFGAILDSSNEHNLFKGEAVLKSLIAV